MRPRARNWNPALLGRHLMMGVVPTPETLCDDDGPSPEAHSNQDNGQSPTNLSSNPRTV